MKQAVCSDGSLFSHLETIWRFAPGAKDSCKVEFYVSVHDEIRKLGFFSAPTAEKVDSCNKYRVKSTKGIKWH